MHDAHAIAALKTAAANDLTARVHAAVESAQHHLLSLQLPDGHWCGQLEGDVILEAEYFLCMHYLGRSHEAKVRKVGTFLRRKQLADGGWAIHPDGDTEVSASVKAYLVLRVLGDDPAAPHMVRARRAILERGGLDACNSFTKIYLAVFGQYPWTKCPSVPPELILFPRWLPFNIYEMSSWSRAILVPLSLISARKPSCPIPPEASVRDELQAEGWMQPKRDPWSRFFFAVDAAVKRLERLPFRRTRAAAILRAEHWILERLEDSDGIGAIFPPIVNTIIGLNAIGYPLDHPVVAGQVRELEKLEIDDGDALRIQPCFSPVWDTAYAIAALVDSGLRGDHPAVVRSARWLVDRRGDRRGDWAIDSPAPHAGFYFEYANPFYPDCDTTAQAITALHKVAMPAGEDHRRCQQAVFEAHSWHLSMQNEDGGWAAFDRGNDRELLTKVPFADHNAMIDPSTSDLTARALECLSDLGYPPEHPAVRAAVEFLLREQESDGSWFGRWGCNYLYGTYLSLWALRRAGHAPDRPEMRRGAAWLLSCQNADGGWGETLASYDDPLLKGRGPSTASQTAWALLGLIAAGMAGSEAARRGVEFLLETQREDGSWSEEAWTGTGFPRVFYLRYHLYPIYFPLMALGAFAGKSRPRRPAASPLLHVASPRGTIR